MTGTLDQPGDDARQRAFHAGDDDDHARGREARALAEQAVEPGDADVVQPRDLVAHQFRRARRFLGDRQVGGAGRGDDDRALARGDVLLSKRDEGCIGVIRCAGHHGPHGVVAGLARARHQQRRAARDDLGGDGRNLGRCFA